MSNNYNNTDSFPVEERDPLMNNDEREKVE